MQIRRKKTFIVITLCILVVAGGSVASRCFSTEAPSEVVSGDDEVAEGSEDPRGGQRTARRLRTIWESAVDPSNRRPAEQSLYGMDPGTLRATASAATDLLDKLQGGEVIWQDFLIDYDFDREIIELEDKCQRTFLNGPCEYDLDAVVLPRTESTGEVIYTRARASDASPERSCDDYARCVAQTRLGRTVRIPRGRTEPFGQSRTRTDNYSREMFDDPKEIARSVSFLEHALAEMVTDEDGRHSANPAYEYHLAMQRARIADFKKLLGELETR